MIPPHTTHVKMIPWAVFGLSHTHASELLYDRCWYFCRSDESAKLAPKLAPKYKKIQQLEGPVS